MGRRTCAKWNFGGVASVPRPLAYVFGQPRLSLRTAFGQILRTGFCALCAALGGHPDPVARAPTAFGHLGALGFADIASANGAQAEHHAFGIGHAQATRDNVGAFHKIGADGLVDCPAQRVIVEQRRLGFGPDLQAVEHIVIAGCCAVLERVEPLQALRDADKVDIGIVGIEVLTVAGIDHTFQFAQAVTGLVIAARPPATHMITGQRHG
jgi:hypothetical protein